MSEKFILSTKFVNDEQYVFSTKKTLSLKSTIRANRARMFDSGKILDFLNNQGENYDDFINEMIKKGCVFTDKSKKDNVAKRIKAYYIDCFIEQSKLDAFSYFVPTNAENHPANNVFAVQCLENSPSYDWVWALIKDNTIGKPLEPGDTLYLLLHEKDVPGCEERFKVWTSKQTFDALNTNKPEDCNLEFVDEKCLYNGIQVCVAVFSHGDDNAIVNLLYRGRIGNDDITKKIQHIFTSFILDDLICKRNNTNGFLRLDVNDSVDVLNHEIEVSHLDDSKINLSSGLSYYVYEDNNGALLTEFIHARTDVNTSGQLKKLVKFLMTPAMEGDRVDFNKIKKMRFPIIVKVYKSFFNDWAAAVPDKGKEIFMHRNKKAMDENLERAFSFFNNSSIWVRLVDIKNEKAFNDAQNEFRYFDEIGLYKYNSAWENLEFNLRLFSQNYLESASDGHGNYVTPLLYGNEVEAYNILVNNQSSSEKSFTNSENKSLNWFQRLWNSIKKLFNLIKKE